MASETLLAVYEVATMSCALVAGVFLAFSDFVMKSLAAAKPAGAIESMQYINRKVFRTIFMTLLVGMCVLSQGLCIHALWRGHGVAVVWSLVGGGAYLVGVLGVTLVFNVPMNNRLEALDHATPAAAAYWKIYVPRWSFWNFVRAGAALGAGVCYLFSCVALARALRA